MTNAWFVGATHSVQQSEDDVRSTVEPIRTDNAEAEAQAPPDWNEHESDNSGQLVGLSPRVKGADTRDSVQYSPWWADAATAEHNQLIDRQVASSGTAARREMAGEQGHGSMQYADSLDPQIRPGAAFGNEFFQLDKNVIQEGAEPYMTPAVNDGWQMAVAQSVATQRSRQAFQSTQYANFLAGA